MFGLNKKLKARIKALENYFGLALVESDCCDDCNYFLEEDYGKMKGFIKRLEALEDKTGITKEKEANKTRGLDS